MQSADLGDHTFLQPWRIAMIMLYCELTVKPKLVSRADNYKTCDCVLHPSMPSRLSYVDKYNYYSKSSLYGLQAAIRTSCEDHMVQLHVHTLIELEIQVQNSIEYSGLAIEISYIQE